MQWAAVCGFSLRFLLLASGATAASGENVTANHSTAAVDRGPHFEDDAEKERLRLALTSLEAENEKLRADNAGLKKKLGDALVKVTEVEKEDVALNVSLKREETLLNVAVGNAKEHGVKDIFRVTTEAPTVQLGNATLPAAEYDDFVMAFSLMGIVACFALPFSGLCKKRCETRVHRVYPFIVIFNMFMLALSLEFVTTINFNQIFFGFVNIVDIVLGSVEQALILVAIVAGTFVAWKFKDRILDTMGVESGSFVVGDFRDWATCWSMRRFQPIELFIWKIEGLPSVSVAQSNNPFCEVLLGYNTRVRTRVHPAAGHSCTFKESLQLNFDPHDTEARLTIQVKHQSSLVNEIIAQVQFGAAQVDRLIEAHDTARVLGVTSTTVQRDDVSSAWAPTRFRAFDLVPTGRIYLRFAPVPPEEIASGSCFDCCCPCFPRSEESGAGVSTQALLSAPHG